MAQYVMQDLVEKNGLAEAFIIDSAATSTEEIGILWALARVEKLREMGFIAAIHAPVDDRADYEEFDYSYGMDHNNLRNMMRMLKDDPLGRVSLLLILDREASRHGGSGGIRVILT